MPTRFLIVLTAVLLPAVVIIALWYPEYHYYSINPDTIDADIVRKARRQPNDSVLSQLCDITYLFDPDSSNLQNEAHKVLKGRFTLFADSNQSYVPPFQPEDLSFGSPSRRLAIAALYPATVLVSAYLNSGNDTLLHAASKTIESFCRFERSALLPRGYLRNDHATAARAALLTRFWKAYRQHESYDSLLGMTIIDQAARTAEYLAREDHFTPGTNHGIMQNLALLQLAIGFPDLPSGKRYIDLAIERIDDQLPFYVSEEGVVLEHSAGYQGIGVELLGSIIRCMKLGSKPIPDNWMEKYQRAVAVYLSLRRPDHSLPLIGDTDARPDQRFPRILSEPDVSSFFPLSEPQSWPAPQPEILLETSGYAVWWDGTNHWPSMDSLTQTVVGFSFFPGHAHKHADEMAIYLWKGGTDFWSATGYWPYGNEGRNYARSWQGSNAPHYARENLPDKVTGSFSSKRTTTILRYGNEKDISAVDLQRTVENLFHLRRQIVKLYDDTWIVIDFFNGLPDGIGRSVWMTSPEVDLSTKDGNADAFILSDTLRHRMTAWFAGSDSNKVTVARGLRNPLLGWQVHNQQPLETSAIVSEREQGGSWSVTLFSFDEPSGDKPEIAVTNEEIWSVTVPTVRSLTVERKNDTVKLSSERNSATLVMRTTKDVFEPRSDIQHAFTKARRKYPRFHSAIATRWKISKALLLVILIQELVLFVTWRRYREFFLPLRYLSLLGWTVGGIWLTYLYRVI